MSLCAARGQRIEDPPLGVHGRGDPGHGRPAERSRGRQRQGEDETGDGVFSSGPETAEVKVDSGSHSFILSSFPSALQHTDVLTAASHSWTNSAEQK